MSRIMIGIPCFDKVAPEVLEDYMRFAYYLGRRYQEHDFVLGIKTKSEQFRARNAIVEGAYTLAADYLLFIDDDHIIDWESVNYATDRYEFLRRLIGHMESDPKLGLVGVLYYHRGGQCKPVLLKEEAGQYRYLKDDEITGGLQEVDIQGGGCMLIRMKALDFVTAPWFGAELEQGTDFQISRRLAKAGFKVACDTSIEIGHLASERKIVTSKNRHVIQADSTGLAKTVDLAAQLRPIYEAYRRAIMDYLQVDHVGLIKLAAQYQEHQQTFKPENADDYYRGGGKPYLARAALLANFEQPLPASWDDFLLRTLRTGIPATGVDFGCGAGRMTYEYASKGHLISFLDLDGVETYEFLKWRVAQNNVIANWSWPADLTADYVIASDVFEHLHNFDVLEKIHQVLKFGGVLLTNYLLVSDWGNPEHINNDKPGFLAKAQSLGFSTVNSAVLQKLT